MPENRPKPLVLIILDGWGYREQTTHNPIANVETPTFDTLFQQYPYTLLEASGSAVGLPEGQMGNSEVGHLHLGSGRKVPQDLTRINQAISSGDFKKNAALLDLIQKTKQSNHALHILGLLSPGGVHSHEQHILALMNLIEKQGIQKKYLHAFLDGRDTPPKSAMKSLSLFKGQIASIMGRYYAMDRDNRWDRTQQAYDCLTLGKTDSQFNNAEEALQKAYLRGEMDEFVKPISILDNNNNPTTIEDGDTVIFMNFRADRARQLTHAFVDENFSHFSRAKKPTLANFTTLTQYEKTLSVNIVYPPLTHKNTLGEILSHAGLHQLRIAETEKYAHVTYFFNGGIETPFPNEERTLIPSPKVATYDLKPEMSAKELTQQLITRISDQHYDVIICNYANPDMVGHTGMEKAAQKAVSMIDQCMKQVLEAIKKVGGEALITADHGNIEKMFDEDNDQPHTAHTNNPVPLIYVGREAKFIHSDGALDDVAPTLLHLLNLKQPAEMTGKNLIEFSE